MSRPERTLIIFADEDERFARGYLAPALGVAGQGPNRLRLVSGHALRAMPLPVLERLLSEHAAIVLVLTPAFLSDPWVRVSEQLASAKAIPGETRVIPLRLIECEVPLRLAEKTSLDFYEETGEARWQHWSELVERLRRDLALPVPAARDIPCPYPGLRPYTTNESPYFHGRASEIDGTLSRLTGGERELFLVGPSGCGKSSLLYAGVLPRLIERAAAGARRLYVRQLRPGASPVAALHRALAGAAVAEAPSVASVEAAAESLLLSSSGGELLVVIDQLEEVFTQADASSRHELALALRALRAKPQVAVLMALRADFFADLIQSQIWYESKKAQVVVAPLSGAALREAIEGPARACGVYLETGLTDLLLADSAEEPGALPLLQETLLRLWQHRRELLVPISAYQAMSECGKSGMATALAAHADRAFAELSADKQRLARRVMLRLVAFGEGRPHTRRRQCRCELRSAVAAGSAPTSKDADQLSNVLDALANARLLTIDAGAAQDDPEDDAVDLCHDALVVGWPQLGEWIDARKADELQRRRLEAAAKEWVDSGRGESGLLDATRYAAAVAWMSSDGASETGWSADIGALVAASRRALDMRVRHKQRRLVIYFSSAAVAAVLSLALAAWAYREQGYARDSELRAASNAKRALSNAKRAESQRQVTQALRVDKAVRAANIHFKANQPQRAIPLLVAARAQGGDSLALHAAFQQATKAVQVASLPFRDLYEVYPHPDGEHLWLYGADRLAKKWHVRSSTSVAALPSVGRATDVAVSPNGKRLAIFDATASGYRLWNLEATPPQEIQPLLWVTKGRPRSGKFDAESRVFLAEVGDEILLWDASTGLSRGGPVALHNATVPYFSVDRVILDQGECMISWSLTSSAEERRHCEPHFVRRVVAVPGGDQIVISNEKKKTLIFWDVATGDVAGIPVHLASVLEMSVTNDGKWLLLFSEARVARVSIRTRSVVEYIALPCKVRVVALEPTGSRALVSCRDSSARLLDLPTGQVIADLYSPAGVVSAKLALGGRFLVTEDADGTLRAWDASRATSPRRIPRESFGTLSPDASRWVAHRDDGPRLIHGDGDHEVKLQWFEGPGESLAASFSPDGKLLAGLSVRRAFYVWDVATARLLAYHSGGEVAQSQVVSWSPDGRRVAASAPDTPQQSDTRISMWEQGAAVIRTLSPSFPGRIDAISLVNEEELLVAGAGGVLQRWSLVGTTVTTLLDIGGARQRGRESAAISDDGGWFAAVSQGALKVWRVDASATQRYAAAMGDATVAFCRSSQCLLTTEATGESHLWDLADGEELLPPDRGDPHARREELLAVDLTAGDQVVTGDRQTISVRSIHDGAALVGDVNSHQGDRRVRFSEDGKWIAVADRDNVLLWNVAVEARSMEEWRAIDGANVIPPAEMSSSRSKLGSPQSTPAK